jgi:hypothetical protein
VSPRSVEAAAKVLRQGTPELARAVEAGTVSVSAGAELAGLSPEEQAQALAGGAKGAAGRAKKARQGRAKERSGAPREEAAQAAGGQAQAVDQPPSEAAVEAVPGVLTLAWPLAPQALADALLARLAPAAAADLLGQALALVQSAGPGAGA